MRILRCNDTDEFPFVDRLSYLIEQQSPGERVLTEADVREVLANPNFHLFVAVDDQSKFPENYLGMGSIFFQRNLARWIAEIHDVVVDEPQRGKHIGEHITRALIATAQRFANERGQKIKLFLTSRPSRVAANALYQKLGFVLVARSVGVWGTNLYKMNIVPH